MIDKEVPGIILGEQVKGLIFDLDGTLVDTMPVHYKASQLACNEHGFDFPKDWFFEWAGIPTIEVFRLLVERKGIDMDYESLGKNKEQKFVELIPDVEPIYPVFELLKKYHDKIPVSIGTGGMKDTVIKTLEATNLMQYFDVIITSDDVKEHKPHPETFILCAEKMGVSASLCQVFEDGNHGISAAKEGDMWYTDVRKWL